MSATSQDWGFGIRAHELSSPLVRLHGRLVSEFGPHRVWILSDDMVARRAWPVSWQVVSINPAALDALMLHHRGIGNPGWQLGDYGAYLWAWAAPELSHYWILEPDVHFAAPSVKDQLSCLEQVHDDLVVPRLRRAPQEWIWRPKLEAWTGQDVSSCLFPLTRMTPAAVQAAYELRRRMAQHVDRLDPFPNDESTVATAVVNAGLSHSALESHFPDGTFDFFATSRKVWIDSLLRRHPDRSMIVHSALTLEEYARWIARFINPRRPEELRAKNRASILHTLHPDDVPILDALIAGASVPTR